MVSSTKKQKRPSSRCTCTWCSAQKGAWQPDLGNPQALKHHLHSWLNNRCFKYPITPKGQPSMILFTYRPQGAQQVGCWLFASTGAYLESFSAPGAWSAIKEVIHRWA